jgi:hypothetical protein
MIKLVFLSLCIVAIHQQNVPIMHDECDNQAEEIYRVCQQEEKYFKENLR